jgi:hypothetical protein
MAAEAAARQHALAIQSSGLPPWISQPARSAAADSELGNYLHHAADIIRTRVETLALDAAQNRPPWTRALGDPPANPAQCHDWIRHLGIIAAYRDQYQITTNDPHQILGPYAEPGHAGHTAYWHAADSVLAARSLTGLEPTATTNPPDTQARARLAADIYLTLPAPERATIQKSMINTLGKAWFGMTNETDDHAVTRLAYSPHLAAILAERGNLSTTGQTPRTVVNQRTEAATQPARPLEAAFAHRRTANQPTRHRNPAGSANSRRTPRPRAALLPQAIPFQMPTAEPQPHRPTDTHPQPTHDPRP